MVSPAGFPRVLKELGLKRVWGVGFPGVWAPPGFSRGFPRFKRGSPGGVGFSRGWVKKGFPGLKKKGFSPGWFPRVGWVKRVGINPQKGKGKPPRGFGLVGFGWG